ncbi:MAG: hypothetical protein HGA49_04315 [Eubacteriaceae bacterium]|nr:hypothetical protein [Eubacteriaceae bacterium]
MSYANNLNLLMDFLKINNSKLAKSINVDPSLISRWRTGKRDISHKSPYLLSISEYLLNFCIYDYQKKYLKEIIKEHASRAMLSPIYSDLQILADWLVNSGVQTPLRSTESPSLSSGIVERINRLITEADAVPDSSNINHFETGLTGKNQTINVKLYQGNQGKRNSVINFLKSILGSDKKHELLLMSEEDMLWMTEDPVFLNTWSKMLEKLVDEKHHITIIHSVNRQVSEIYNILNYWIPLHLKGKISSYYYPKYLDSELKRTYFIKKDGAAIVSYSNSDTVNENYTFYYDDPISVRIFEQNFYSYIRKCETLLSFYNKENKVDYIDQWSTLSEYPGCYSAIRNHFNSFLLPQKLISAYFHNPLDIGLYESMVSSFNKNIAYYNYTDYVNLNILDEIVHTKMYRHSFGSFLSEGTLVVKGKELISLLETLLCHLREYENYNLYFYTINHDLGYDKLNIFYKENHGATFNVCNRRSGKYLSIVLDESNLLRAIDHYFDDFKAKIPSFYKSKKEVIILLEKALDILKS